MLRPSLLRRECPALRIRRRSQGLLPLVDCHLIIVIFAEINGEPHLEPINHAMVGSAIAAAELLALTISCSPRAQQW
jgi:hypothetical protein